MSSLYNVGDTITIRLGGMEFEELFIEGVVEEVRPGNPPRCSTILPEDPYCYKLEGQPNYYRETSVTQPRPISGLIQGILDGCLQPAFIPSSSAVPA